jgi:hypothetical protein
LLAQSTVLKAQPQNEAKEKAPSTWPSASLAQRLSAAVPQTRPDQSGLRPRDKLGAGQCITFIRIQPPRSAALNGNTKKTLKQPYEEIIQTRFRPLNYS